MESTVVSVSELVALINQTLEFAYPMVTVEGEVSSFRVSKNRWVYFDLKDDQSTVRFFGSVYNLTTPIEDGMLVKVTGTPRLHNQYGFSVNVQSIALSGEGSIKRAFDLLKAKLEKEGLFSPERKRAIPEFPQKIGLITSSQAAAYSDFIKIINQRWGGLDISLYDVQVQGEAAVDQIVKALDYFSKLAEPVDVVVVVRGGGSIEDLAAFSAEPVVRAVSASRTPTIVGIGHESDISLAELAADIRASTPTNAAQIVVPDSGEVKQRIDFMVSSMAQSFVQGPKEKLVELNNSLVNSMENQLADSMSQVESMELALNKVDPKAVLKRGYTLVRDSKDRVIKSASQLKSGDEIMLEFGSGKADAEVK